MALTLDDLVARFGGADPSPDGWLATCPAHDDSHRSLRLAVSDAGKVLLKCRAGCETPAVLSAVGLSLRDLATADASGAEAPAVSSTTAPASPADVAALAVQLDRYAEALGATSDPAAVIYAADRFGLSDADVDRLGLGLAADLGGGPRLVVPFRDREGVARGFQARALDADASVRWMGPRTPSSGTWSKLGYFPGSSGWDEVLVTEGPGDALTAAAAGYDAIAIRGAGLASSDEVVETLVEWIGEREAVVAGDGDPSGRRFSATLGEALVDRGVRTKVLDLADGLDLTDWRTQAPARFATELIRAIATATPLSSRAAALARWDESRYSLTDLGGARYLRDYIVALGSGVRYAAEVGFLLLEGGVWRKDEAQRVRTYAQAVADVLRGLAMEAAGSAVTDAEKKHAARLNRYAAHAQTTRGLDSMLRELQAVEGVPARYADFDRHEHLLAVRNGVVNLRTGDLGPHDPALMLTRLVDVDYRPDARAPRWEAYLEEVFPAYPDLPDYMRRLVGYGITGSTAEQCFAVHWGTGANGKSVFTDTLTEVFREHTTTTPFSTFEDRGSGGIPNDLAALKGARLVMASEGEQGRPMAEAVLKRVTGRDMISARFMRQEFFEFRPTFLLMLATNFKPSFRGQDEGLWRRVKLIPWERYFRPEERDHRLGGQLLAESEGILAWAVRGAREWYAHGLRDPEIIRSSTKEYRETSDALSGFLPGVFVEDTTAGRVLGKVLFDAYLEWADEENLPGKERWTRRTFFGALEERGFVKKNTNRGVAFDGLRRASAADRRADDEADEADRAADAALSDSSVKKHTSPPTAGPSLADVL